MTVWGRWAGRDGGERTRREVLAAGLARVCGDVRLGGWRVSCGRAPSGWEWNRSQPCQGATELGFPRPALWQMQGEAACRAGEPSGQGEEPSRRVLVVAICSPRPIRAVQRARLWAITCTASQAPLAAKRAGRHVVQTDAVLEVSNGVLDLGVAAVVGLQFQGLSVPVGDEAVIAVGGEEGQLGTGRGLHPPDDEPHRCGAGLSPEGGVGGLRHIGGAVQ